MEHQLGNLRGADEYDRTRTVSVRKEEWQGVMQGIADLEKILGVKGRPSLEHRIPYRELLLFHDFSTETWIQDRLVQAGFDWSQPIARDDDFLSCEVVFTQVIPLAGVVDAVRQLVEELKQASAAAGHSGDNSPALGGQASVISLTDR